MIPGVADWYATTMADGYDFANVLVKTREGRPIQIMPNKDVQRNYQCKSSSFGTFFIR